jgi:hypothetical protein
MMQVREVLYHQTLRTPVLLKSYFLSCELGAQTEILVSRYNRNW